MDKRWIRMHINVQYSLEKKENKRRNLSSDLIFQYHNSKEHMCQLLRSLERL